MPPRINKRTVSKQIRRRESVVRAYAKNLADRKKLLTLLKECDPGIVSEAISCIGSTRGAASWLTRPQRGLNGRIPVKVMSRRTREEITKLLGRIKFGSLS